MQKENISMGRERVKTCRERRKLTKLRLDADNQGSAA